MRTDRAYTAMKIDCTKIISARFYASMLSNQPFKNVPGLFGCVFRIVRVKIFKIKELHYSLEGFANWH